MKTNLKLFRINRGLSNNSFEEINNVLSEELCLQNFNNGIETTVYLDTNIISAIRKFTFKETSLDSRICNIIEQVIGVFNKFPHIYISPGLALEETCDILRDKNITAFNIFLEQYLPRFTNAYNYLDYESISKPERFYLFNTWASIFAIQYVKKKYSYLTPFEKFKEFLSLLQDNLEFIDGLTCEIAKYAFIDLNELSENHKKIVKNFIKLGNIKKQSLNAAYDLILIKTIAMSHNRKFSDPYVGKMDCWGLSADNGVIELANLISFSENSAQVICINLAGTEKFKNYLISCFQYYDSIILQRSINKSIQKNININTILNKAEEFITKLENELI